MSRFIKKEWISLLAFLGFVFCTFYYGNKLPNEIPIHFNLEGEADGWGSKWIMLALFPVIGVLTYLLLFFVPKIDPKKKFESTYDKPLPQFRSLLMIMLFGIELIALKSAISEQLNPQWLTGLIVALVFVGFGNFMNSIKPNYFIGFRTPWTLENAEVWKLTHRLVSKIWVFGGIIYLVLMPGLTNLELMIGLGILLILGVILPVIYSYRLSKSLKNH